MLHVTTKILDHYLKTAYLSVRSIYELLSYRPWAVTFTCKSAKVKAEQYFWLEPCICTCLKQIH